MGIGVVVAIVLAAAALIVSLVRQPDDSVVATSSSAPATLTSDTSAADKALCEKVGPLLREALDNGRRFVALGDPGTPGRDAGITAYRDEVEGWARRIQDVMDADATPQRFLTRTLQSFVDFNRLYAGNIRPGPEKPTDAEAWDAGTIALGGPWETCHALGVTW